MKNRELVSVDDIEPNKDSLAIPGIEIYFLVVSKAVTPDGRLEITTIDGTKIDCQPDKKFWIKKRVTAC